MWNEYGGGGVWGWAWNMVTSHDRGRRFMGQTLSWSEMSRLDGWLTCLSCSLELLLVGIATDDGLPRLSRQ
jgi:hypothetical protein